MIRGSHADLQRAYEPARLFDDASTEKLSIASAVITATPWSFACWFTTDVTAAHDQTLCCFYDAADSHNWRFYCNDNPVVLRTLATDGAGTSFADATAVYVTGEWQHAATVCAADNARAAYLDGGNKGTNAVARSPANAAKTWIAGRPNTDYVSGNMAWPTIWNVALTDAEVAALGNRQHFTPPWEVRPESIVSMVNMRTLWDPYLKVRWSPTGTKPANPPWLWRPRHVSLYVPGAPALDYLPIRVPESRPTIELPEVVAY